jgi:hypothetical protein
MQSPASSTDVIVPIIESIVAASTRSKRKLPDFIKQNKSKRAKLEPIIEEESEESEADSDEVIEAAIKWLEDYIDTDEVMSENDPFYTPQSPYDFDLGSMDMCDPETLFAYIWGKIVEDRQELVYDCVCISEEYRERLGEAEATEKAEYFLSSCPSTLLGVLRAARKKSLEEDPVYTEAEIDLYHAMIDVQHALKEYCDEHPLEQVSPQEGEGHYFQLYETELINFASVCDIIDFIWTNIPKGMQQRVIYDRAGITAKDREKADLDMMAEDFYMHSAFDLLEVLGVAIDCADPY